MTIVLYKRYIQLLVTHTVYTVPLSQSSLKQLDNICRVDCDSTFIQNNLRAGRLCLAEKSDMSRVLRQVLHQLTVYVLKARPVFGISPPATQHQLIDGIGATRWLGQVDLEKWKICH